MLTPNIWDKLNFYLMPVQKLRAKKDLKSMMNFIFFIGDNDEDILGHRNNKLNLSQKFTVKVKDSIYNLDEIKYHIDEYGEKIEKLNNRYTL